MHKDSLAVSGANYWNQKPNPHPELSKLLNSNKMISVVLEYATNNQKEMVEGVKIDLFTNNTDANT
jgi:hypothetical protein